MKFFFKELLLNHNCISIPSPSSVGLIKTDKIALLINKGMVSKSQY